MRRTIIAVLACTVLGALPSRAEQGYETPPMLEASQVLPDKMQAGDRFKVQSRVQNDGYLNRYIVDSDFGQFDAYGDLALARLIHEIHALKWFGVTGAERKWYKKLQVDPYTRNQTLRKAIKSVAHVDAAANFGMRFMPIPSIPGVDYLRRVNDAVWNVEPAELREQNTKKLQEAGVDEDLIEQFMTNENLSPSQQTLMLTTLGAMEGVEGRDLILRLAAEADSVDVAEFNMANSLLLAAYHKFQRPVTKVFSGAPVPASLDADNRLVILVSADYAFWVDDLGGVITVAAERFDDLVVKDRELWLRGRASKRFGTEMQNLGWGLKQEIALTEKVREQFTQPAGKADEEN